MTATLFTEIEKLWIESPATGHQRLNCLDMAKMEAWIEAEIPEWAVRIGVELSLQRWKAKFKGDRVRSIAYCEQEVFNACETHSDWIVAEYWERERRKPC
ncbi:MAG TPA: hypothetical protein VGY31_03375 [Terriglobia bacterium]|nr:hypothetical protein [Terriglobia bacterium]